MLLVAIQLDESGPARERVDRKSIVFTVPGWGWRRSVFYSRSNSFYYFRAVRFSRDGSAAFSDQSFKERAIKAKITQFPARSFASHPDSVMHHMTHARLAEERFKLFSIHTPPIATIFHATSVPACCSSFICHYIDALFPVIVAFLLAADNERLPAKTRSLPS